MSPTAISNYALCYEGIQRVYRNAVVEYVRLRLKAAYPTDYVDKAKKPFQKEWEQISVDASQRRVTGELASELVDDLDVLGVNHFFNLFDSQSTVLMSAAGMQPDVAKTAKQTLLRWMQSIKALRDPLSHPSHEELPYEDSFVLLDCARRVLLQLGLVDAAKAMQDLASRLSGSPQASSDGHERSPLEDRLPAREAVVVQFVGRTEELAKLRKWFDDPLSRRWALVGAGGLGKSALAYAFAESIRQLAPPPYQAVIWLSAKVRRFEEGKTRPIDVPEFSDLDTSLSRLLSLYGWQEEAGGPLETKRSQAIALLNAFPALVVVDDVDSLEGPGEDAIEFFTIEAPQTKSKVLLTSRRTILGLGGTSTHVHGLSKKDAEAFIRTRYEIQGLDNTKLDEAVVRQIAEATGSSPLFMADLVRLASVMPIRQVLSEWKSRSGDDARRYALGRELDKLSASAKEVLAAACISNRAVTYEELKAITGHSQDLLASSLGELQKLFLMPKPQLIDGEDRFDVEINTRTLVRSVLETSDMWRRLAGAHSALSGEFELRQGREEVGALCRKAVLLVRTGSNEAAEALLKAGLENFPNAPSLLAHLGFVYKTWRPRRRTDAKERFQRAYELKWRDPEMYKHWIRMELEEKEWSSAHDAATKGLERLPGNGMLQFFGGYSLSRLGKELERGLHAEKARQAHLKAHILLEAALASVVPGGENGSLRPGIYRALCLNWEHLGEPARVFDVIRSWRREYPEDQDLVFEEARLGNKFGRAPAV